VITCSTKVMVEPAALDCENTVENDAEVGASDADVREATRTQDEEGGIGCAVGVG